MIASAKHLEIQMSMPIQAPPFSPPIRGEGNASIYLFVRKIYFTHEKMTFSYNENCRGLCHVDLDTSYSNCEHAVQAKRKDKRSFLLSFFC